MTVKLSRARTQTVIRALRTLKKYASWLDTPMQVDDANEVMMECEHLIDYLQQQVDKRGECDGKPQPCTVYGREDMPGQAEATARLIAAAPDLYVALDWLIRVLNEDMSPEANAAWDAGREALAKADGRVRIC